MRFEVQYPKGPPHEIELQGTVAILGRDPSCDLVLNDAKCSRRHAVLEAGPQGIAIRDTGSANGVYVNGKKVERAQLAEGDVVRLGEVRLTVLPEDVPGTLVMGPEDMDQVQGGARPGPPPNPPPPPPPPPQARPGPAMSSAPAIPSRPPRHELSQMDTPSIPPAAIVVPPRPAPAAPPPQPPAAAAARGTPAARAAPRPTMSPRPPARETSRPPDRPPVVAREPSPGPPATLERPLTVTVLASLWAVSAFLYAAIGIGVAFARGLTGTTFAISIAAGVLLAIFSVVVAVGLFGRRPWARFLQIAAAAVGILSCAFSLSSITVLIYMLRPATAAQFSSAGPSGRSREQADPAHDGSAETAFTLAIVGTLFLGGLLLAVAGFLAGRVVAP